MCHKESLAQGQRDTLMMWNYLKCSNIELSVIGPDPWFRACDKSRSLLCDAEGEKSPFPSVSPGSDLSSLCLTLQIHAMNSISNS